MGMFNEVYKECPECGEKGYAQIAQIVLGFGDFDLDDYNTIKHLSEDDLVMLYDRVKDTRFRCQNEKCGNHFSLEDAPENDFNDRKLALFKRLFGRK